jgi:hypothetical protein
MARLYIATRDKICPYDDDFILHDKIIIEHADRLSTTFFLLYDGYNSPKDSPRADHIDRTDHSDESNISRHYTRYFDDALEYCGEKMVRRTGRKMVHEINGLIILTAKDPFEQLKKIAMKAEF